MNEDRASDPALATSPLTEDATPRVCVVCAQPRGPRTKRFCSYACHHQWRRENPPRLLREPSSPEEFAAEAKAALDELRTYAAER